MDQLSVSLETTNKQTCSIVMRVRFRRVISQDSMTLSVPADTALVAVNYQCKPTVA